jgi:hypothetical protein
MQARGKVLFWSRHSTAAHVAFVSGFLGCHLLGFLAVAAFAQTVGDRVATVEGEIRGTVTEDGTSRPLMGALVTLRDAAPAGSLTTAAAFATQEPRAKTLTDSAGHFAFTVRPLGAYRIDVSKEGFGRVGPLLRQKPSWAEVMLDAAHRTRILQFTLGAPGRIRATFLDADSKLPIKGLRVFGWQYLYLNGTKRVLPGGSAVSDERGVVELRGLTPAAYLIGVRPEISARGRLLVGEDAANLPEESASAYPLTYWPGGGDIEMSIPMQVQSGDVAEFGRLYLKRKPLRRVRVDLSGQGCEPEDMINVSLTTGPGWLETLGTVPCGKSFVVNGFSPGSYLMYLSIAGRDRSSRRRSMSQIEIYDKDVQVHTALVRGVDVEGRFADDRLVSLKQLSHCSVSLRPVRGLLNSDETPSESHEVGRFRIENSSIEDQRVEVAGLPDGYYVKEISYNGSAVRGHVVTIEAGAAVHSLVITLDNRPAVVGGQVSDARGGVEGAYVVLVPWPSPGADLWPLRAASGDTDGKFQFSLVPPGEYRILAVTPQSKDRLEEPEFLMRLLPSATKVVLSPGAMETVNLGPTAVR